MTVKELKDKLNRFPDDLPVMLNGYAGGWDDLKYIEEKTLMIDYWDSELMGRHENITSFVIKESLDEGEHLQSIKALCLSDHELLDK